MTHPPNAPTLLRCLGEITFMVRPDDRCILEIDFPRDAIVVLAQHDAIDAVPAIVELVERKAGPGYRLRLPQGDWRVVVFVAAALETIKTLRFLFHRHGAGPRNQPFRRRDFAASRLFLSPALRVGADPPAERLRITTTLNSARRFCLAAFPFERPLDNHHRSEALKTWFRYCELGPGENDIPSPFAADGAMLIAIVPWSGGSRRAQAANLVGAEAAPALPAPRQASATAGAAPRKRIHVVGAGPRTGTTLMAEAICACFDVDRHSAHEDSIFTKLPGEDEGGITVTKLPGDITVARALLPHDPDLYFIFMLRDPRDSIVSVHDGRPGSFYAGLRLWKAFFPYWLRLRSHPRVITVRYEDLVADPDAVQAQLRERLPFLVQKAPFSRFHEVAAPSRRSLNALNGLRPIASASVGQYRNHLGRIRAQVEMHGSISDSLVAAGYERDATWEERLRDVPPDTRPSHLQEFEARKVILGRWATRRRQIRAFIAERRIAER